MTNAVFICDASYHMDVMRNKNRMYCLCCVLWMKIDDIDRSKQSFGGMKIQEVVNDYHDSPDL